MAADVSNIPPPPAGFTVDSAPQAQVPPPPPGFSVDKPVTDDERAKRDAITPEGVTAGQAAGVLGLIAAPGVAQGAAGVVLPVLKKAAPYAIGTLLGNAVMRAIERRVGEAFH